MLKLYGNCYKKNIKCISIIRKLASLIQKHEDFLSLVKNHGEGIIEYKDITCKKTNSISRSKLGEIIINNPSRKNAISGKMMFDLANVIDKLITDDNSDDKPIAIIIRNEGNDVFCSGADLNLVKEVVNTPEHGYSMSLFMTDALNRLRQSDIITLTAINGKAIGGGAELTTVSDFRLMSERQDNYIQFVHVKLGAALGWGGAARLYSILNRTNCLKLLGASLKVNANDALDMNYIDGTFNKDASYDAIISESLKILQPFLNQEYIESVRAIKRTIAINDSIGQEFIKFEQEIFKSRWQNRDNKEALKR